MCSPLGLLPPLKLMVNEPSLSVGRWQDASTALMRSQRVGKLLSRLVRIKGHTVCGVGQRLTYNRPRRGTQLCDIILIREGRSFTRWVVARSPTDLLLSTPEQLDAQSQFESN